MIISKNIKRGLVGLIFLVVLMFNVLLTWVDQEPYKEKSFYERMTSRLDSLESNLPSLVISDSLKIGWSKISITPENVLPLAGYGVRNPLEYEQIHDSLFVRSIVLDNGIAKVAIVSADLLIIHPEVKIALNKRLNQTDWIPENLYLTATHTHASIGAWAPGFVGKLIAGNFDEEVVKWIAEKIADSIIEAEKEINPGTIGYGELSIPDMIKNRLVGLKGTTDPLLKVLLLENTAGKGIHGIYGAHATCLDHNFKDISGDYPSAFNSILLQDSSVQYSGFSAGAVASMGPGDIDATQWEKALKIGATLAEQTKMLQLLGVPMSKRTGIRSFQIPIELRDPGMKVTKNLVLRPWVFKEAFGNYISSISVLQVNDLLLIGTPCDFSGELAIDLHQYARNLGLNLIITSFNGGYIGYVPHDQWYDLDKNETRTMTWYGFDNGAYFSEVITRIIDISVK